MRINAEFLETPFKETVRELANYLYLVRGCRNGHDLDNWLEAERQMKSMGRLEAQSSQAVQN